MIHRTPIGKCPKCRRTIVYSNNPKKKKDICVAIASEKYDGETMLCAKCKTMLTIIDKKQENNVLIPFYDIKLI